LLLLALLLLLLAGLVSVKLLLLLTVMPLLSTEDAASGAAAVARSMGEVRSPTATDALPAAVATKLLLVLLDKACAMGVDTILYRSTAMQPACWRVASAVCRLAGARTSCTGLLLRGGRSLLADSRREPCSCC
jgi:hypothetical protein